MYSVLMKNIHIFKIDGWGGTHAIHLSSIYSRRSLYIRPNTFNRFESNLILAWIT